MIEEEIKSYYVNNNKQVEVINSAEIVAEKVKKTLTNLNILSSSKADDHLFFVSDFTSSFEESSKIFFGKTVKLTKVGMWK
ncbi:MAG: glutamate racemase [Saprospiraceae bacterium]